MAIRYYNWDGDAARLREDPNGGLIAEFYRRGKGFLPMGESEIFFNSFEINKEKFDELIREEDSLGSLPTKEVYIAELPQAPDLYTIQTIDEGLKEYFAHIQRNYMKSPQENSRN